MMLRANPLPLQNRVFGSLSGTHHQPEVVCRPRVYKEWGKEQMVKAYNAVRKEGLSYRKAAAIYGVPRSTLSDYVTVKVLFGSYVVTHHAIFVMKRRRS